MKRQDKRTAPAASPGLTLRQRAEASLRELPDDFEALSPTTLRQMFHDLRVHQVELEMQNEELRATQLALDTARERYFDFYDLAPVGYLTVNERGLIEHANLTTATLLGVARGALIQQPISHFILKADQEIFYRYRQRLIETQQARACELRLLKGDGTPFWGQLEAITVPNEAGATGLRIVLSDISERKQLELALAESESLKDSILNSLPAEIAVVDHDGVVIAVNQPWRRFALENSNEPGQPASQVDVGTNYLTACQTGLDLAIGGVADGVISLDGIRAVLDDRMPRFRFEYPCHSPQQQRWFSMVVTRLGNVARGGAVITHTDITQRVQAEMAQRESAERFQLFMNALPAAAFIKDERGTHVFINRYMKDSLGAMDWDNKSLGELFSSEIAEAMLADDQRARETGYVLVEEKVPTTDGQERIFQTHKFSIPQPGKPPLLGGIALDITERKQAELELRQSEQRFRDIARVSADWIWEIDAHARYTYVSEGVKALLGYLPEDVLGKTPFDFMPTDAARQLTEAFGNFVAAKTPFRDLENIVLAKEGTAHITLTSGEPILDPQGNLLGYRGIDRDITERKRAEEQLRGMAAELERKVIERTTQLRKISAQLALTEERERRQLAECLHDNIGQLLAVIKIKLSALSAGSLQASVDDIVTLVEKSDQAVRMLTHQLSPPILKMLGFVPALDSLIEEMQRVYGLTVRIHDSSCSRLLIDEIQAILFRSARELLINVAKHAKVSAANLSVSCVDESLRLVVSDAGCGFTPADFDSDLPKIGNFGLFSIHERITNIGGNMKIDSHPGHGTTITLSLPCAIATQEARQS